MLAEKVINDFVTLRFILSWLKSKRWGQLFELLLLESQLFPFATLWTKTFWITTNPIATVWLTTVWIATVWIATVQIATIQIATVRIVTVQIAGVWTVTVWIISFYFYGLISSFRTTLKLNYLRYSLNEWAFLKAPSIILSVFVYTILW